MASEKDLHKIMHEKLIKMRFQSHRPKKVINHMILFEAVTRIFTKAERNTCRREK